MLIPESRWQQQERKQAVTNQRYGRVWSVGKWSSCRLLLWDCQGQHWSHSCALTRLQCSIVHSRVARGLARAVFSSISSSPAQTGGGGEVCQLRRMQLFLRRIWVLGSKVLEVNCLSASEQHVLQPIDCIKSLATTQPHSWSMELLPRHVVHGYCRVQRSLLSIIIELCFSTRVAPISIQLSLQKYIQALLLHGWPCIL